MTYIVFEGVDGSGKTTIINNVTERLNEKGYKPLLVKECEIHFAGTPTDLEQTLAYSLERAKVMRQIQEYYKVFDNPLILSDRSWYSTLAYQGNSRRLRDYIREVNSFVIEPDFIIYLDHVPTTKGVRGIRDDEKLARVEQAYQNYQITLPYYTYDFDTDLYSEEEVTDAVEDYIIGAIYDDTT